MPVGAVALEPTELGHTLLLLQAVSACPGRVATHPPDRQVGRCLLLRALPPLLHGLGDPQGAPDRHRYHFGNRQFTLKTSLWTVNFRMALAVTRQNSCRAVVEKHHSAYRGLPTWAEQDRDSEAYREARREARRKVGTV